MLKNVVQEVPDNRRSQLDFIDSVCSNPERNDTRTVKLASKSPRFE